MRYARPAVAGLMVWVFCLFAALHAHATGTGDPQPAATLLLPYFEVDLDDPEDGVNTTFVIRNGDAAPVLAHLMLFTDLGIGTMALDLFLTGYDALTIDLRALFAGAYDPDNGELIALPTDAPVENPPPPPTAEVFATDFEGGAIDEWSAFQSRVTGQTLQAWHTGGTSDRRETCAGVDHGDNIARGYILVDNVIDFSGDRFPDADYFGAEGMGATGIVSNNNVLWGEFEMSDSANNFSVGSPLVHIPAESTNGFGGTFYARYNAIGDLRLALQGAWGTRFANAGVFDGGTSIIYWRDPGPPIEPFICGPLLPWTPLGQSSLIAFDEESNMEDLFDSRPFPYACGRVAVGSTRLPTTFDFGWLYVNFATPQKGIPPATNQGIIMSVSDATGRLSTGQFGIGMDNAPITEGEEN